MKCSEFDKRIYLYDELTSHEREEIDAHVSKCTHCMQTMSAAREMLKLVAQHQSETPSLRNHAAMTRGIMDAVANLQQKRRSRFQRIVSPYVRRTHVSNILKMRFHMAGLSLLLVVCFFWEYSGSGKKFQHFKYYPSVPAKTELNLAAFHSEFLKTKKESKQGSIPISDCVARCFEASTSDCKECADKFLKR